MTNQSRQRKAFELHPQLRNDTMAVGDLSLCSVLLMNDARFPWLILVPRLSDVTEIFQLTQIDQTKLLAESSFVSVVLMEHFVGDKLNVAAIGNIVPQLHVHHIVRYKTDLAWPKPVWGHGESQPYTTDERDTQVSTLRKLLAV